MDRAILLLFFYFVNCEEIDNCPFQCECLASKGQFITNCGNAHIRSAAEITIPSQTTHLNLSSNSLEGFDGLVGLTELEVLDLSNNIFQEVEDSSFKDLPKLKVVNLANNLYLRIVNDYAFFSLPNLEHVSLQNCKSLAWISYRAFYDSYGVKELDLSFTNITALQESLLLYSPNLRTVNLESAPIECDCINDWLLTSSGRTNILGVECTQTDSIPCLPRIIEIYKNQTAVVKLGSTVTLKCIGIGYPVFKTYIFNKNGTKIGRNGRYQILEVEASDEGVYTCKTMNKYGIISKSFRMQIEKSTDSDTPVDTFFNELMYSNGDEIIQFSTQYNVDIEDNGDESFDNSDELNLEDDFDEYDSETVDIGEAFTLPTLLPLNNDIVSNIPLTESTTHIPKNINDNDQPAPLDSDMPSEPNEETEMDREIRYQSVHEWRTKSCPANCQCTINDLREKKVECDNADLTLKRQSIPTDLTILVVNNSTFDLQKIQIMRNYVTKLAIIQTEYNSVSNVDFDGFSELDELTISAAGLTEISADAFEDIKMLRSLDLSYNELKQIPAEIFMNLTRLESLVLENNPLEILDRNTFSIMTHLKTLNLIDTEIEDFPAQLTEHNKALMTLWLDQNHLIDVPDFRHLSNLNMIRLSNNPIEFIKQNDFSKLANLQSIFADEMKFLIAIERNAFTDLPLLTDISISYSSKLSFIHPKAFRNCPNLRTLNLQGNALFTLGDMKPVLPNLQLISLDQNPLNCDCSLSWLTSLEFDSNALCNISTHSSQPILLKDVSEESLQVCQPRLHVPRLRSDDAIYVYEDEEVHFGCYSTLQSTVRITGPAGTFDDDVIKFAASRDNIGKYVCESSNGLTKEIRVKLIGDEDESSESETESSFIPDKLHLILMLFGFVALL